jgi:hypothetical protein
MVRHLVPHLYVVSVAHGDDMVLLNAVSGQYYSLNPTGRIIWSALQDQEDFEQIALRLAAEYEQQLDMVRGDVTELIQALVKADLVTAPQ